MAGDSKAAGARVEASRMSPVHFTAMQGVVLRREGQRLPLLESKNMTQFKKTGRRKLVMMHLSACVWLTSPTNLSVNAELTSLTWGLMAVKGPCWLRWGVLPSTAG